MKSVENASARLTLSGALTLRQIRGIHEELCAALRASPDLYLDIDGVTEADLSLIQVVEAARISAAAQGGEIRLARPADGVIADVLLRGGFLTDPASDGSAFWLAPESVQ